MQYTDELNCGVCHDPLSKIYTNHGGEGLDRKKQASWKMILGLWNKWDVDCKNRAAAQYQQDEVFLTIITYKLLWPVNLFWQVNNFQLASSRGCLFDIMHQDFSVMIIKAQTVLIHCLSLLQFRCCGVTNHTDWFEVYNATRVPDSCCLEYSDNCGLDNPGTWWTAVSTVLLNLLLMLLLLLFFFFIFTL